MNGNEPIIILKGEIKMSNECYCFIALLFAITFALAGGRFNLTKNTYVLSKGILRALGEFIRKIIK